MANPTPRLEMGGVRLFTATYSAAPAPTPIHALYTTSGYVVTLVNCATASSSSATEFYRFVTVPNSRGYYISEWTATFSSGTVLKRDLFQIVKTT